jgi:hypothetical protein
MSKKMTNPETQKTKKKYVKPKMRSENLMTFGALCNGTTGGGRKQVTGAPDFCSASKLLS